MMPSKLLQGTRIRLTALTSDDLPVMARWYEDAGFLRMYDARPALPRTEPALARWLEGIPKSERDVVFAIRTVDRDDLIGKLELDGILWTHGVCGIAIAIGDPANRGKGYGTEAAQLALAFAFDELNLHRVQATVFSYNERSLALFEKLGFQREGVYREFLQRDGRRYDMLLYGLLDREWRVRMTSDVGGVAGDSGPMDL